MVIFPSPYRILYNVHGAEMKDTTTTTTVFKCSSFVYRLFEKCSFNIYCVTGSNYVTYSLASLPLQFYPGGAQIKVNGEDVLVSQLIHELNGCQQVGQRKQTFCKNLHKTRGITPKRVTSGGNHLRGLTTEQHSSEESLQWWQAVGDTVSDLTEPVKEPYAFLAESDAHNN